MSVELFALGYLGLKAWLDEQLATGRLPSSQRLRAQQSELLAAPPPSSVAAYVATEMPATLTYVARATPSDPDAVSGSRNVRVHGSPLARRGR